MAYLHAKNIAHRDIKLDNIIYDPQTELVKIIDFGFATVSKDPLKVFCGTPSYMAPEIVAKQSYFGSAADLWAVGIVMFVLLTGNLPFKADDEKCLFRKIQKGILPPNDLF